MIYFENNNQIKILEACFPYINQWMYSNKYVWAWREMKNVRKPNLHFTFIFWVRVKQWHNMKTWKVCLHFKSQTQPQKNIKVTCLGGRWSWLCDIVIGKMKKVLNIVKFISYLLMKQLQSTIVVGWGSMHMCLINGNECPLSSPLKGWLTISAIVTNLTHVLHHVFLNFGSMDVQVVGQKLVSFGINGKFGFMGVCNKVTI